MLSRSVGNDESELSSPFSEVAHVLREYGLAVLPVGGDDGKTPLVEWAKWTNSPGPPFITKMVRRHVNANLGVICHLSRVTVIDIDNPALLEALLDRFGLTPLVTRTPSAGFHLWYRHAGERSENLRSEGLEVDIKGVGGFVVVPPSIARRGKHTGIPYVFERGSWDELAGLPKIRPGSLQQAKEKDDHSRSGSMVSERRISKGQRNDTLFGLLLQHAPHCDTFGALYDVAHTLNDSECDEPLPPAEIEKIAHSVWGYERRGENWVGQEARAQITRSEFGALVSHPDALALLLKLRLAHSARSGPFAISPKAMAKDEAIAGWRHPKRYRKARDQLVRLGWLICVYKGGSTQGDPHQFRLCSPAGAVRNMGACRAPNITKHPPPMTSLLQGSQAAAAPAFGQQLRLWRREAGLSQAETARRAGVGRSAISNIETGRVQPPARIRQLLEAVFATRHAA